MRRAESPKLPRVFGTAGGSLVGATWAANAAVARVGRPAEIADRRGAGRVGVPAWWPDGVARPGDPDPEHQREHRPRGGVRAAGADRRFEGLAAGAVLVVGRHGVSRVAPVRARESTTPRMAVDGLTRYLKGRGVRARLVTPVMAVWPSSDRGRLSVALLAMGGCRVVRGERLARAVRRAVGLRPADPEIVDALRRLLNSPGGRRASTVLSAPRRR